VPLEEFIMLQGSSSASLLETYCSSHIAGWCAQDCYVRCV